MAPSTSGPTPDPHHSISTFSPGRKKHSGHSLAVLFPSSIVAEGMPPIPVKLIEKIRKWEYVDLVCLLEDHNTHPVSFTLIEAGQWVPEQQKRRKPRTDIFTWIQATPDTWQSYYHLIQPPEKQQLDKQLIYTWYCSYRRTLAPSG